MNKTLEEKIKELLIAKDKQLKIIQEEQKTAKKPYLKDLFKEEIEVLAQIKIINHILFNL